MVVAQLAERSLPIPENPGSNQTKIKKKRPGMAHFKKMRTIIWRIYNLCLKHMIKRVFLHLNFDHVGERLLPLGLVGGREPVLRALRP